MTKLCGSYKFKLMLLLGNSSKKLYIVTCKQLKITIEYLIDIIIVIKWIHFMSYSTWSGTGDNFYYDILRIIEIF